MPGCTSDFEGFPPHLQLLLLAAQARLTPELQSRRDALADSLVDWSAFVALAEHHRLAPTVFVSLGYVLPPAERQTLHDASTRNAFAALRAAAELRRIREALVVEGFATIALKGVALSQLLYGTPNARHVGDLDLLTTREALPRQVALLREVGYTLLHPEARLTPRRALVFSRFWKDFTFENLETGFELDLHWRLFNNPAHPANRLLDHPELTQITVFNVSLQTLSLRDQFLYAAAHGVGESFTYLKALADVAAFLRVFTSSQLDDALRHAEQIGLLAQLSAAIHLANCWMLTGVESPRLLPASHALARKLRRRTLRMLLTQGLLPTRSHPSPASWLRFELQLMPGLRSVAEAAGRFLFRPRVWSAVDLPDALFPVYPVLGLLLPPRRHRGQSQAAPRTPLESPKVAGSTDVSNSPPKT